MWGVNEETSHRLLEGALPAALRCSWSRVSGLTPSHVGAPQVSKLYAPSALLLHLLRPCEHSHLHYLSIVCLGSARQMRLCAGPERQRGPSICRHLAITQRTPCRVFLFPPHPSAPLSPATHSAGPAQVQELLNKQGRDAPRLQDLSLRWRLLSCQVRSTTCPSPLGMIPGLQKS